MQVKKIKTFIVSSQLVPRHAKQGCIIGESMATDWGFEPSLPRQKAGTLTTRPSARCTPVGYTKNGADLAIFLDLHSTTHSNFFLKNKRGEELDSKI